MDIFLIILAILGIIIVLIFLIILLVYFHIIVLYNEKENFKVFIKFGFLKIRLYPPKKKKKPKVMPSNTNDGTKLEAHADFLGKSVFDKIQTILEIISKIQARVKVGVLKLIIDFGQKDAAQTAINIGRMYALTYGILGAAQNYVFIKKPEIEFIPHYNEEIFKVDFYIDVRFKLWFTVKTAIRIIRILSKNQAEIKKNQNKKGM